MKKNTKVLQKYVVEYAIDVLKKMQKKYTISFYTGGINVNQWKDLSKSEKTKALKKSWYLRWSFRNPNTNKLERQSHLKAPRAVVIRRVREDIVIRIEDGTRHSRDQDQSRRRQQCR